MHADRQAVLNRARRMLVDRCFVAADGGGVVGILCAKGNGSPFDELNAGIEQHGIARSPQVMHTGVRQPQQIVGEMGSHACAGWRVPPVLHVAFGELA